MDEQAKQALAKDQVIDITTVGRRSGQLRRIEIWFHRWDGRFYITGVPGRRSWVANLRANPEFTFHLKASATADLPARAHLINEETERRLVLTGILTNAGRASELEAWVKDSPLIEVEFLA